MAQRAFVNRIVDLKSMPAGNGSIEKSRRISLVIPHYNQLEYLPKTIESAMAQSLPPAEILVIDDGSPDTDGLECLEAMFRGKGGFRLLRPAKKLYAGGAREYGREAAIGDLVAYCDADDVMHPRRLELMASVMESHTDAVFVVTGYVPFSGEVPRAEEIAAARIHRAIIGPRELTKALGRKFARNRLSWIDPLTGEVPWYAWGSFGIKGDYDCHFGSPLVKKEVGEKLAWSDPGHYVFTPYEDYEYCSLLQALSSGGYQIDLPLLYYRKGSTTNLPSRNAREIKDQASRLPI